MDTKHRRNPRSTIIGAVLGLQSIKVRSQLAANLFLMRLAAWAPFCYQRFTYLDVASAFGLNAKYASKMLSRLGKRRLLQADRRTRYDRFGIHRGVLNTYSVSERGWRKVSYLSMDGSALQTSAADQAKFLYLLHGTGSNWDYLLFGIPPRVLLGDTPRPKFRQSDINQIMMRADPRFIVVYNWSDLFSERGREGWALANRAIALGNFGMAPSNVSLPTFAIGARYLGASDEEIWFSLFTRKITELNEMLAVRTPPSTPVFASDQEPEWRKWMRERMELEVCHYKQDLKHLEDRRLRTELIHVHTKFLQVLFWKLDRLGSGAQSNDEKRQIEQIQLDVTEMGLLSCEWLLEIDAKAP